MSQNQKPLVPVILCGGVGSRLWPLSRQKFPKQFVALADSDESMLQLTVQRVQGEAFLPPVIVTNGDHRFLVAEHLRAIGCEADILLEPEGRNTAPAIAAAALFLKEKYGDANMLVLPSDHLIKDDEAFQQAVVSAHAVAADGHLVTFGITPQYPETGYGYIRYGDAMEGTTAKYVSAFVEKPDAETAETYVESGEYAWNSGMFLFSVKQVITELTELEPFIMKHAEEALKAAKTDEYFVELEKDAFTKAHEISIDYALMERTKNAAVVPVDCGWSDAGSWDSLWRILDKDEDGNVVQGNALLHDTTNTLVRTDGDMTVATLGLDNAVVVTTNDVVMVADQSRAQDVKALLKKAQAEKEQLAMNHTRVYRPWGHYETIEMGNCHQVKHIEVSPGARLSVQKHNFRAEHWVIVSGMAKVRVGDEEKILTDNQYVHIPLGDIHCIENIGPAPLTFIEVQHGIYLGEDDIVRYDDLYGRVEKADNANQNTEEQPAQRVKA